MLYKPEYCCSCGDRIERIEWNLLTSRRFCEFCEAEHKAGDWLLRAAAGLLFVFGLFGASVLVFEPEKNTEPLVRDRNGTEVRRSIGSPNSAGAPNGQDADQNEVTAPRPEAQKGGSDSLSEERSGPGESPPPLVSLKKPQKVASGPVYICGAQTKKGSPCSRKVKDGGRCWQHKGKEAVLPKEKLLVKETEN